MSIMDMDEEARAQVRADEQAGRESTYTTVRRNQAKRDYARAIGFAHDTGSADMALARATIALAAATMYAALSVEEEGVDVRIAER